jgi:phosphoglycerate kinase
MKTLKDLDLKNKKVLVRVDFNVPLGPQGEILDDFRIRQTLPTIEYLMKQGAEIILMSHLGDPGGKFVKELVMAPVDKRLEELLGKKVTLLENLRFNPGEEKNDDGFAKELAKNADVYVNDAFGVCHRNHASVSAITKYLPAAAGLLLEKEIETMTALTQNPKKPLVAIIGGAKVETKVGVIEKISQKADFILVSGLIHKAILGQKIQLKHPEKIISPVDEVGEGKDIGIKTIALFEEKIAPAKTIFWNGPVGRIEDEHFVSGTKAIAQAIVKSRAFSIIGGGETVEFINKLGLLSEFSHVSTGGGAMLAFLSGEKLPGLEALK